MPRYPKPPKGWLSRDVEWRAPNRKGKVLFRNRPIAYSTVAANILICALAEDGRTIQEVHDAINYDQEARAVLQKYIDKGYGGVIARKWFSR